MDDKLLIRLSVAFTNIWMLYSILLAWCGEETSISKDLFGFSVLGAIILCSICFSQGKYHCRWMQALCLNILFSQSITVIDSVACIFPDAISFLVILTASWFASTILAFYFAISHFIKVKRLKRQRNG